MRTRLCAVALGFAWLAGAGCNREVSREEPAPVDAIGGPAAPKLTAEEFTPFAGRDSLGVEVRVDDRPERIVSLAPSHTETLFAIGAGDRVVGVSEECNYPPEAASLAKMGPYTAISAERLVAAKPDLVLAAMGNPRAVIDQIRDLGITVYAEDPSTYGDVVEYVRTLGDLAGCRRGAEKVRSALESARDEVAAASARRKGPKPVVLFVVHLETENTLWLPGRGTYIDDMIGLAGGRNVAGDEAGWPAKGLEELVASKPEIIIGTHKAGEDAAAAESEFVTRLRGMGGWRSMPAVLSGRVHLVDADSCLRPGPRLADTVHAFGRFVGEATTTTEPVEP